MRYRVFLSHARADETFAGWLHGELLRYRVPRRLVGVQGTFGAVSADLNPIYFAPSNSHHSETANSAERVALGSSEALVVLCSPAAALSDRVNQHIDAFLALGRVNRIFPVVVAGVPGSGDLETECFPRRLRGLGIAVVDLRTRLGSESHIGSETPAELSQLASALLGIADDSLLRRDGNGSPAKAEPSKISDAEDRARDLVDRLSVMAVGAGAFPGADAPNLSVTVKRMEVAIADVFGVPIDTANTERIVSANLGRAVGLAYIPLIGGALLAAAAASALRGVGGKLIEHYSNLSRGGGSPPSGSGVPSNGSSPSRIVLSAFAPKAVKPSSSFLVQASIHAPHQAHSAMKLALERDPKSVRRGITNLVGQVEGGDRVRLTLDAGGLRASEPVQSFRWAGSPIEGYFEVCVLDSAATADHTLTLRAYVNGTPVGRLSFRVSVTPELRIEETQNVTQYEPYRYAFLSYASEDRAAVLARAQMLSRLEIPFFQDIISLRSGERWEPALEEHMGRADVVFLFWSQAAAKSEWVRREVEWALDLQARSASGAPEIAPIMLDGPPPATPPASLQAIHFNDPLRCIMAAYE